MGEPTSGSRGSMRSTRSLRIWVAPTALLQENSTSSTMTGAATYFLTRPSTTSSTCSAMIPCSLRRAERKVAEDARSEALPRRLGARARSCTVRAAWSPRGLNSAAFRAAAAELSAKKKDQSAARRARSFPSRCLFSAQMGAVLEGGSAAVPRGPHAVVAEHRLAKKAKGSFAVWTVAACGLLGIELGLLFLAGEKASGRACSEMSAR